MDIKAPLHCNSNGRFLMFFLVFFVHLLGAVDLFRELCFLYCSVFELGVLAFYSVDGHNVENRHGTSGK